MSGSGSVLRLDGQGGGLRLGGLIAAGWAPWPKKRLWPQVRVSGIRSIPGERLRSDIEIARPGHGPVTGPDAAKEGVVGAQPIEHGTPE